MRLQFRRAQSAVLRASLGPSRFVVAVCGRRFGKTYLGVSRLLAGIAKRPGLYWYVAPTRVDAKEIAWDLLKTMAPRGWLVKDPNESELALTLRVPGVGASKLMLKGAERPASLRGRGLSGVVLDEFADMPSDTWPALIRPALADRQGWAIIEGTPQGFDHLHQRWQRAHELDGWAAFQFTTLDGGMVPLEEVEAARADLDPRTFRQEYEASFEAISGRIYYGWTADNVRPVELPEDPAVPLVVGMDFNVDPMTAVVGYRATPTVGRLYGGREADELHVTDELVLESSNTAEMAERIMARWGQVGGRRRHVHVYPDPTGRARKTSAPIGQTDLTILRDAGMEVHVPDAVYAVVDRHNTVNRLVDTGSGHRRLFVNPRCRNLLATMQGHTYKPGTRQEDEKAGLDHAGAALGYLACGEFPLRDAAGYTPVRLHGRAPVAHRTRRSRP